MKEIIKFNKKRLIAISILLGTFLILILIRRIVWVSEYIFARGFSRYYGLVVGKITSIIPFSIFEILIIAAIILGIIFLFKSGRRLRRKQWERLIKGSLNLIIVVVSVLLVYTMTASMNYYRLPVELNVYAEDVDNDDILTISNHFLNDFNNLAINMTRDNDGNIISPYTDRQLAKIMREEFKKLDSRYYNSFVPLVKPIIFSRFMSYNWVTGVSFQPTAEPNINRNMPSFDKPFTMAHEIAHNLGVMREDEANLIAAYITLSSSNDFVRYSGYMNTFYSVTGMVRYSNGATISNQFYDSIHNNIFNDYNYVFEYWASFESIIDKISSYLNDLYLKMQGQPDGVGSYDNSFVYDIIDNGDVNEYGEIIYDIIFSDVQKVYFTIYYDNH